MKTKYQQSFCLRVLCWTQSTAMQTSSTLCAPFPDGPQQRKKKQPCICMLKWHHYGENYLSRSDANKYIPWLRTNGKDTPLRCGCQQQLFWACQLWSFWRVRPTTVHIAWLGPQLRSSGILLLSGQTVPGAPETRRKGVTRDQIESGLLENF